MATKQNQKNQNQAIAGRLAYLRSAVFVLEGIKHDEDITPANARAMYYRNLRKMNGQSPTPSMRQR